MTEFGVTPWGRDWVRLAEPTSLTRPNPALPKARSLARNDRVHDVATAPGEITATAEGNDVRIVIPLWTEAERDRAAALLADRPAGDDLPDTTHRALHAAGLPLTPDDVTSTCGCTSRGTPCRHVLAVYFDLARRVDERPMLAVRLRGGRAAESAVPAGRIPLAAIDPATFYGD